MGAADDLSASRERPLSVLVVDDNVDAANMLAEILTLQGHAVAVGYSSAEALALAAERSCDLYVLDIGLPDIDGFELARQLRAMPGNADAVLVAVTGYGQPHDKVLSRAAGFDHHLVKPVDIAHLDSIVRLIKA
jgi:DNA-binding response OmpR family regulator